MIQKVAFGLIGGGILVALGYFLYWFFTTSGIALGFKIAIALVVVGIVLLLAGVIWERYQAAKKEEEEFKEVKY
jgi:membrane protein DedA with SNARE-associated domain